MSRTTKSQLQKMLDEKEKALEAAQAQVSDLQDELAGLAGHTHDLEDSLGFESARAEASTIGYTELETDLDLVEMDRTELLEELSELYDVFAWVGSSLSAALLYRGSNPNVLDDTLNNIVTELAPVVAAHADGGTTSDEILSELPSQQSSNAAILDEHDILVPDFFYVSDLAPSGASVDGGREWVGVDGDNPTTDVYTDGSYIDAVFFEDEANEANHEL